MHGLDKLVRSLRRRREAGPTEDGSFPGVATVLDGRSAVAAAAAEIGEALGFEGSPGASASIRHPAANLLGRPLTELETSGPGAALAAAIGCSLSGLRATVLLEGPRMAAALPQLRLACDRHVPLVAYLSRPDEAGAATLGTGVHETYHAAADTGAVLLFASNVQEAVDLGLAARWVAERALLPVLVAMDGPETAAPLQDVKLPARELVRRYLGDPRDDVPVATPAQRLLFGDSRRRIPCWYDLDRPALHGARLDARARELAAAAQRPYFLDPIARLVDEAFSELSGLTGRRLETVTAHRSEAAGTVVITQGAAVEPAEGIADFLSSSFKQKVGVVGIRCLRPFPAPRVSQLLRGRNRVLVLERLDAPLAGEPPLARELRSAVDRALENGRFGEGTHPGYPVFREKDRPRIHSIAYGLGGSPLRVADLVSLLRDGDGGAGAAGRGSGSREAGGRGSGGGSDRPGSGTVYLGIDFAPERSAHPKRQVLLDTLRRHYPDAASLGVRSSAPAPDLRPEGSIGIAVHHPASLPRESGFTSLAAGLLGNLFGGGLRSRLASNGGPGARQGDRLILGAGPLGDPGDGASLDVAVIVSSLEAFRSIVDPLDGLADGGALLLQASGDDEAIGSRLPPAIRQRMRERGIALYIAPPAPAGTGDPGEQQDPHASRHPGEREDQNASGESDEQEVPHALEDQEERNRVSLLGALVGVLQHREAGLKPRRIATGFAEVLGDLPETEREFLGEVFQRGLDGVRRVETAALSAPLAEPQEGPGEVEAPATVRRIERTDDAYDSLPRFWDQTGVLYRTGETGELVPDPYLATGTVPPLSSTFHDVAASRATLPELDPTLCTGCGRCWTLCPDGAIGPVAIGAGPLLEAALEPAKARGHAADSLRPVISTLASRVNAVLRDDAAPATAGELFPAAFDWLMEKMAPPEDRRKTLATAFDGVLEVVRDLQVTRTDPFFSEPESKVTGSGELLSLAINPDACKGCDACVTACDPGALAALPGTPQRAAAARARWKLWEALPDTKGETIERLSRRDDFGPHAAMLLSRHCLLALASGDDAEPGSGEKVALRLILGSVEYHQQPVMQGHLEELTALREKLAEKIRESLVEALPTRDLDLLAEGIQALGTPELDLHSLAAKLNEAQTAGTVDADRLGRRVEAARSLADLSWRLSQGLDGLGRARCGIVVSGASVAGWAGAFPYNPFQIPVAMATAGEAPALVRGLVEGQVRRVIEGVAEVRRSRLELDNPDEAAREATALRRLTWSDLTEAERRLCPPLLLVGEEADLREAIGPLTELLETDLPVKVICFAGLGGDRKADGGGDVEPEPAELGLLALGHRRSFVLQASIAHPDHLVSGVLDALRFPGPAWVQIHAPSPRRHGFAADRAEPQARLAVASRAFPLFRYDPALEGVFGSRLDLAGNPSPLDAWASWAADGPAGSSGDAPGRPPGDVPAPAAGDGSGKSSGTVSDVPDGLSMTPADWARTEARFAAHFALLGAGDPSPTPLAELLVLPPEQRAARTPYVETDGGERLRVSSPMVKASERWLETWRALQELAGAVTPFTEKVRAEIEARVAGDRAAELAAQQREYESRLSAARAEVEAELVQRLGRKLAQLSARTAGSPAPSPIGVQADPAAEVGTGATQASGNGGGKESAP